jgi:prolyl 4-hydroxylase
MTDTQRDRVAFGKTVRDRLSATPAAFKIPAAMLDLFVVRDFLTQEECAGLIRLIDEGRQPSTVLGDSPDPDYRTSETCNLNPYDPLIRQIERKITALMGIPRVHGETIQGQRYAPGQQFKQHHDFFFTDQPYWQEEEKAGGQRTWTAMIFLNQPEAGGQTFFEKAGVRISPRVGNLVTWNNMDGAGDPNFHSLHQGMPVEAGTKYIITKWYRERPWHGAPEAVD